MFLQVSLSVVPSTLTHDAHHASASFRRVSELASQCSPSITSHDANHASASRRGFASWLRFLRNRLPRRLCASADGRFPLPVSRDGIPRSRDQLLHSVFVQSPSASSQSIFHQRRCLAKAFRISPFATANSAKCGSFVISIERKLASDAFLRRRGFRAFGHETPSNT